MVPREDSETEMGLHVVEREAGGVRGVEEGGGGIGGVPQGDGDSRGEEGDVVEVRAEKGSSEEKGESEVSERLSLLEMKRHRVPTGLRRVSSRFF